MTTQTILITRASGDETGMMEMLQQSGHRVIHEPVTSIYLDHTRRQDLQAALSSEPDAIIVTSRHAVQALSLLSDIRDVFLICVGESTAETAESLGFSRAMSAGGTVERMAENILASYDEDTRFLYLSAEHVRADLAAMLSQHGVSVERLVLYAAVASEQISDVVAEHLRRRQIDAVTFMSQRSAEIFTALLAKADLLESITCLKAFCISRAVADALEHQPWQQVYVSEEPTLASMVECVDNALESND